MMTTKWGVPWKNPEMKNCYCTEVENWYFPQFSKLFIVNTNEFIHRTST